MLLLLSGPVGLASSLSPGNANAALVEELKNDVATPLSPVAITPTHVKATGRIVASEASICCCRHHASHA